MAGSIKPLTLRATDTDFAVKLNGLEDVDQKLALLGDLAGERVMRSVLFSAAQPIETHAEGNISVIRRGSGALAKATRRVYLRAGSSTLRATGSRFVVAVAPKVKDRVALALANFFYKRRRPIRGVFWGHLVEWGFTHVNSGVRIPGRQVFTRAARSAAPEALALFANRIRSRVDRALKKQQP
jgi:hypothetical protein